MAVVIGNIPMIYPLFMGIAKKVSSAISSSKGGTPGKHSGLSSGDALKLEKPPKPMRKRKDGFITGFTTFANDSQERIMDRPQGTESRETVGMVTHYLDNSSDKN